MAAQLSMPLDLRTPAAAAHQTAHQTAAAHQRLPLLMLHPLPAAAASAAAATVAAASRLLLHLQNLAKLAVPSVSKLPPKMLPLLEGPALSKLELPLAGPALAKIELPPAVLGMPEGPALAKAEPVGKLGPRLFESVGPKPFGKCCRRLKTVTGQPYLADFQFPQ